MTAKELYLYGLTQATEVVQQIQPEQLTLETPDSEWDVRQLLAHMVYEVAWTADIVRGSLLSEVGDKYDGDLLGDDFKARWRQYARETRAAVTDCDEATISHLSYAQKPVGEYLLEAGNDQLIHAWDAAQAIGVDLTFEPAVARQLYDQAVERQAELTDTGLFAVPVSVPETASTQVKLLALLGRSYDWRTSSN